MTALDRKLAEIAGRADAATDGPTLTRYESGGGRLARFDLPRKLVADFYNEPDREFYFHARTDVPALLRLVAVLREQLGVARLFVHRDWCFVNDCSNETPCRDYFDGIERSDAAALAALEGE